MNKHILISIFFGVCSCHSDKSKAINTNEGEEISSVTILSTPTERIESETYHPEITEDFLIYKVDFSKENIQMYWKDDERNALRDFEQLKSLLNRHNKELRFAMNGGIYMADDHNSPLGLYIENGKTIRPLNTKRGNGNFYLQPNGVFYITKKGEAGISTTNSFKNTDINWATQSGPLIVQNGKVNPLFTKGFKNLNIRNGVGITSEGKVFLMISTKPVSFYDFANNFISLSCQNALYLDGAISNAYFDNRNAIPGIDNFGVMIAVIKKESIP